MLRAGLDQRGRFIGDRRDVTTAAHLPRAAACFRRQGFDVFPCGCHYRANDFRWSVGLFIPKAQFAENSDSAAHEWVGLLWYWMHGRI